MDHLDRPTEHRVDQLTKNAAVLQHTRQIISRELSAQHTFNPIPTFELCLFDKGRLRVYEELLFVLVKQKEGRMTNFATSDLDVENLDARLCGTTLQTALHVVDVTSLGLGDVRQHRKHLCV